MAKYFRYFPKTFYTQNPGEADTVTNIISRFAFENDLVENDSAYYEYEVKDTDTPEIIAGKFYGGPEKHWVVLGFNQIIDPQWDWPLDYNTFIKYVDNKYTANADTANSQTGLAWSQSNTKEYFKVVTRTDNQFTNNKIVEKLEIDASTYANTTANSFSLSLSDGSSITIATTLETRNYYDYEDAENESKRTIKLLKPNFVKAVEKEFKRVIE